MVLYRFLFAPVLLVVALVAGGGESGAEPAAPPAVSRQAPSAPASAVPLGAERPSPHGEAQGPSLRRGAAR